MSLELALDLLGILENLFTFSKLSDFLGKPFLESLGSLCGVLGVLLHLPEFVTQFSSLLSHLG